MGLLQDTGEYPAVSGNPNAAPFLDPYQGYVLGERPVPPAWLGPTTEQPAAVDIPRRRRLAGYARGLLSKIVDSPFMIRLERRLFK